MRELGLKGTRRLKVKRTTIAGKNAKSAEDLIKRNFHADAPNKVWVADFTYVSTWEGWCYVAVIIDVFARRVLGYDVSVRLNKAMVARAFNMAV
jgi:transposase InsO family protein